MNSCVKKVSADDRPHPGPLPQERENHSPVLDDSVRSTFPLALCAEKRMSAKAQLIREQAQAVHGCSLSPGEWVRVRASVQQTVVRQHNHFTSSFTVSGIVMLRKTSSNRPSSLCNSSTCQPWDASITARVRPPS